ncbi:unnamed protein product [Sordaria macrospora k-hell]|uniref:WGS project CABT00000000 data, contig 2.2 n=1 Tax=Sordaria macrospora (strain ATCC MYA-333 / DSM 997 / K(L3346) / K-hell) TaxID=771870 RepID=F7VNR0_SORMK|nr:uncharacterized protein SMAC_01013 [Sordaria macrospora k-hell]CCC06989.1 unnamed protein product [Sordaria macrospora k-hell]
MVSPKHNNRDSDIPQIPPQSPGSEAFGIESIIYKSDRPSNIPIPTTNAAASTNHGNRGPSNPNRPPSRPFSASTAPHINNTANTNTFVANTNGQQPFASAYPRPSTPFRTSIHPKLRFLTPSEWARIAHSIGGIADPSSESRNVVHPTCWYWPPRGMPEGLYRDIVLGAVLTALGAWGGSEGVGTGTPITILAAVNTTIAGLLALMHNSGLPDRLRLNKVEFEQVADHLKELLDTGIVEVGQGVDDVLNNCFSRFHTAKATVWANMPDSYTSSSAASRDKPQIICPDPTIHLMVNHEQESIQRE